MCCGRATSSPGSTSARTARGLAVTSAGQPIGWCRPTSRLPVRSSLPPSRQGNPGTRRGRGGSCVGGVRRPSDDRCPGRRHAITIAIVGQVPLDTLWHAVARFLPSARSCFEADRSLGIGVPNEVHEMVLGGTAAWSQRACGGTSRLWSTRKSWSVYFAGSISVRGPRKSAAVPYPCWIPGACSAVASVSVHMSSGAQLP